MRYNINVEETMKADLMAKILTGLSTGFLIQHQLAPEKLNALVHGWRSRAHQVIEKAWENYVDQGGLYQVRDLQGEQVAIVNPARWASFGIMYSMTLASLVGEKGALAGRNVHEILGQAFLQASRYEDKFMEVAARFETSCSDQDVLIASTQVLMTDVVSQCVKNHHQNWQEIMDQGLLEVQSKVNKVLEVASAREIIDRRSGDPDSYKLRATMNEACSKWAFDLVRDEKKVSSEEYWRRAVGQALRVNQDQATRDVHDVQSFKAVVEAFRARQTKGEHNENTQSLGPLLPKKNIFKS